MPAQPSLKIEIEYSDPEELRVQLGEALGQVRPILEERKMAFSEYDYNVVGNAVRALREALGLTREEVASRSPVVTVEHLRQIEESTDRVSNPTLVQLRQLASILNTTVADLVEPDLGSRLLGYLESWITTRNPAARFGGVSPADRNRLIRRVLLRVIDSLEE